jgi:hypothetical protein
VLPEALIKSVTSRTRGGSGSISSILLAIYCGVIRNTAVPASMTASDTATAIIRQCRRITRQHRSRPIPWSISHCCPEVIRRDSGSTAGGPPERITRLGKYRLLMGPECLVLLRHQNGRTMPSVHKGQRQLPISPPAPRRRPGLVYRFRLHFPDD